MSEWLSVIILLSKINWLWFWEAEQVICHNLSASSSKSMIFWIVISSSSAKFPSLFSLKSHVVLMEMKNWIILFFAFAPYSHSAFPFYCTMKRKIGEFWCTFLFLVTRFLFIFYCRENRSWQSFSFFNVL